MVGTHALSLTCFSLYLAFFPAVGVVEAGPGGLALTAAAGCVSQLPGALSFSCLSFPGVILPPRALQTQTCSGRF